MSFLIKDAEKHVGKEVMLQGWMYNRRGSGKIAFLQLRDGSGVMQGIVEESAVGGDVWGSVQSMTIESSVRVSGVVEAHPKKESVFEMQVRDVEIVCLAPDDYPIGKKEHGPDFLLQNRHLWLRSNRQRSIMKVRDQIFLAMTEWLHESGFLRIDTPIFNTNSCEGSTTLFEVDYFDEKAYLAQSGQLYLEAAILSCGRGYDFGPVFRAEKSKTRRHLTEFWMMDAEMAFCDLEGMLKIEQDLITHVLMRVLQNCRLEFDVLERDTAPLEKIKGDFIVKTHKEVVDELREMGSQITYDKDLGAEDETMIMEKYDLPMFVTHYPAPVKAFYMKRDEDGSNCLCADLLAPEGYGEIIGGSQREDDLELLQRWMGEHGVKEDGLEWYMDLRKYGSVPHSGFGVGLERLVAWICGLNHVRETIAFPRMLNRLRP
jgi:asparaginyl-tRNA synthetase